MATTYDDPFDTEPPPEGDSPGALVPLPSAGAGSLPQGLSARQVRTQYVTAMSVPKARDLAVVERRFLLECAQLGARAYYSWAVGGDKGGKDVVEGPSINLALALARCYGNCAIEPLPMEADEEAWYYRYAFIDLETGFTLIRPFRQSRQWRVFGRFDDERKEDIRFQIGASKAIRNVTLNALPEWLINKGMERAKQGERARIESYIKRNGLDKAQAAIVESLEEAGVPQGRVLARLGRATPAALTVEDLVSLRGDLKALQLGQELADTLFPLAAVPKEEDEDAADTPGDAPAGPTAQAKRELRRRAAATPPETGRAAEPAPAGEEES
jgi:hypothetical protein